MHAIIEGGRPVSTEVSTLLRGIESNAVRARLATLVTRASVLRLRLRYLAQQQSRAPTPAVLLELASAPQPPDDVWPTDPVERLIVERSCPRWLAERLRGSLGHSGADAFLRSVNVAGPVTLRANLLKCDRSRLLQVLASEGIAAQQNAVGRWAVDVSGHANLFGSAAWRGGLFEVQDAGSQIIADRCGARPGDVVVDLCAGRGGKTLALAAAMEDQGRLWVHDVDDQALRDQKPRLRRAGVTCVVPGLPEAATADVVLVDAPCSSLGVLRRWPDLRYRLQAADVEHTLPLQRELLLKGARLVRPGGRLVYATCSVLDEENVRAITPFPEGFALVSQETLLPHVEGTDGFFIAVMQRRGLVSQ